MIQLISRGDDAGNSYSANRAIRECCEQGLLRNVSVLVPGPAFDDAVRVLEPLKNVALGLHVCLSSEWDTPRWEPVAPREQVPSLLDESGMFTHTPGVLRDRGFSVEEALLEIRSQLGKARSAGLEISYIDEHMGVSWIHPDLRTGIAELARREGLVDAHNFQQLQGVGTTSGTAHEKMTEQLRVILSTMRNRNESGVYSLVSHPMCDDDEARRFQDLETSGVETARARNNDRLFWQSDQLQQIVRDFDIQIVRYTDV